MEAFVFLGRTAGSNFENVNMAIYRFGRRPVSLSRWRLDSTQGRCVHRVFQRLLLRQFSITLMGMTAPVRRSLLVVSVSEFTSRLRYLYVGIWRSPILLLFLLSMLEF